MTRIGALFIGLVFGLGLIISGMTNPAKVIGFLDLFGNWDPSLALVMGGAVGVGLVLTPLIRKRGRPLFGDILHLPTRSDLTPSLVLGSFAFGAGWGLGGFCPGPALVSLGMMSQKAVIFVGAMIIGMLIHHWITTSNLKGN